MFVCFCCLFVVVFLFVFVCFCLFLFFCLFVVVFFVFFFVILLEYNRSYGLLQLFYILSRLKIWCHLNRVKLPGSADPLLHFFVSGFKCACGFISYLRLSLIVPNLSFCLVPLESLLNDCGISCVYSHISLLLAPTRLWQCQTVQRE